MATPKNGFFARLLSRNPGTMSVLNRRANPVIEWFVFIFIAISFCALSFANHWFWKLDAALYDNAINSFAEPAPDDMVLIAIDDETLARIGQWPWTRETLASAHARMLKRINEANAKAVLLDFSFTEPSRRDNDEIDETLARAMQKNGHIVIPVSYEYSPKGVVERLPIEIIGNVVAAKGHAEVEQDADGIVRTTYLFEGLNSARWPHASLALLRLTDPDLAAIAEQLGDPPLDSVPEAHPEIKRQHWYHIPFYGSTGHFTTYSYWRWLTGEIPDEAVTNKVVFIGFAATSPSTSFATPVSGYTNPMSNIEISMNLYQGLRNGVDLYVVPRWVNWLITTILIVLLFFAYFRLRPGMSALITLLMIGLGLLSTRVFLVLFGCVITPGPFIVCSALAYPFWMWRRLASALFFLEQENDLLRQQGSLLTTMSTSFDLLSHEPVARGIEALRETRERLERARVERETFLNFLSHDMRSPQSSIIALIEMRQRGTETISDEMLFSQIKAYAMKTSRLAEEFVQMAKASSLTPDAFKEVELTAIIDEAIDALWTFASGRNITIVRDYDQVVFVNGHAPLLARAFQNLIHNAVKFSPENGTVTVRITDNNGYWDFEIVDQGPGLSREAQRHLLGMRGTAGGSQETGLVLGLALVRTVLDRHGSVLKIDSTLGKGSTFYFRLPMYKEPVKPKKVEKK